MLKSSVRIPCRYTDTWTSEPPSLPLWNRREFLHHMIDIVDPDEPFDAQRYAQYEPESHFSACRTGHPCRGRRGNRTLHSRLIHGLFQSGSGNTEIRLNLKKEADMHGIADLYRRLSNVIPKPQQEFILTTLSVLFEHLKFLKQQANPFRPVTRSTGWRPRCLMS